MTNRIFRTRRSFLVKEENIVKALKVLNRRRLTTTDTRISNCGGLEKDKWCIEVKATDTEWAAIEGIFIKEGIHTY